MLMVWWTACRDCGKESGWCADDESAMAFILAHWCEAGHERGVFSAFLEDEAGRLCSDQFWGITHDQEQWSRLHRS